MSALLLAGDDAAAIAQAAQRLAEGSLVAFPTETVYGLGARADADAAVAKIFAAKGRPSDHPLIVHVTDIDAAEAFAARIPPLARRLAEAFWPGPLTVIVPRRAGIGEAASGGQETIGLRCPAHPVARALLHAAAERGVRGVAAPSANRFGRISPTRARHVLDEFTDLDADALCVLDGGACDVGIESAIVDCSRDRAVLLRPGVLTREQLRAAAGEDLHEREGDSPRASGTLAAHYAPRTPLRLMDTAQLKQALQVLVPAAATPAAGGSAPIGAPIVAVYSRSPAAALGLSGAAVKAGTVVHRPMPADPQACARELFDALRELDASGARLIWVETPPDGPQWEGVLDRLRRAAAAA